MRFGSKNDPNGTAKCPRCKGNVVVSGTVCPSCLARQTMRNVAHDKGVTKLGKKHR